MWSAWISFRSRSIPACAGEPVCVHSGQHECEVYPRVCGGTLYDSDPSGGRNGLSPRVRGNHYGAGGSSVGLRSIPACAGEPQPASGEALTRRRLGLSPRVRGNQCDGDGASRPGRSIPACAGEPGAFDTILALLEVYPRVCGGTYQQAIDGVNQIGLSPRVRGNPPVPHAEGLGVGSIPACAGEPPLLPSGQPAPSVYPRVCGGTGQADDSHIVAGGLSPRVRGNLANTQPGYRAGRSIPACAGEPTPSTGGRPPTQVYPRVCGGTEVRRKDAISLDGLSPRVRGNPQARPEPGKGQRSIPACAGEPGNGAGRSRTGEVYPRVCGGTSGAREKNIPSNGLSPRVRGNLGVR